MRQCFENPFHLSAYVPKQNMNAADLIKATLLQSLVWISNFKKSLADTTISKVLARWFENTLHHSTKETRTNPSYHPALANSHSMYYYKSGMVTTGSGLPGSLLTGLLEKSSDFASFNICRVEYSLELRYSLKLP
jgi:hypothetical protein